MADTGSNALLTDESASNYLCSPTMDTSHKELTLGKGIKDFPSVDDYPFPFCFGLLGHPGCEDTPIPQRSLITGLA